MITTMPKAGFETKKISTETLGEYLSEVRQSLGFSPEQVQRLTQIPVKYLTALEEGNYTRLPSDIYVRGFLKTLAAVYCIPAAILVEQFEKERSLERSLRDGQLVPRSSKFIPAGLVITPKTITFAVAVIGVVVSIGYLIWQIRSVTTPPPLVLSYPAENLTVGTRNILLRGQTEPGSKLFINGQHLAVDEDGAFREVINLIVGTNNLLIRAENKFGKSSELKRSIAVTAPPATSSNTDQRRPIAALTVTIKIGLSDTWVKIAADGQSAQDGIVEAGKELQFTAEKELILSSGNAGATRILYNGLDLGLLGKEGEVVSNVRFTAP